MSLTEPHKKVLQLPFITGRIETTTELYDLCVSTELSMVEYEEHEAQLKEHGYEIGAIRSPINDPLVLYLDEIDG